MWQAFDYRPDPRVVFGAGSLDRLAEVAKAEGLERSLFVSDPGLVATPHVDRAMGLLREAGVEAFLFSDFGENPDTDAVERGARFAAERDVDSLIGFGGGSSMDCAKGINFLVTNGGRIQDYWGFGKATKPLLPMIGVPTTAGTGSEAQSYALISDAKTHVKMACADLSARFRVVVLDPELTVTQPTAVTATAGYDALAHAVETYVTTKRTPLSDLYSKEAFDLLSKHYARVLTSPDDLSARSAMQLGAYYAGVAIENSMLGATHACANPLTQHYGTTHGRALAMCLPTVVRFNAEHVDGRYSELERLAGLAAGSNDRGEALAGWLEALADAGGLPTRISSDGVPESVLPELAKEAAVQLTGRFNPRPFDEAAALEVYQCAF